MTDETRPPALVEAEARTRHARERLFGTLDEVQVKLNPVTLAQDAVGSVANGLIRDSIDTVRTRPGAITAAAGLAVLFLVRKPLARLLWKSAKHATVTVPASLKARRAKSAAIKIPTAKKPHPKKGSSE